MDVSLYRLLKINRWLLDNISLEPPITSTPNPTNPEPPVNNGYVISDFGTNVLNNHNPSDSSHSEHCQIIFDYITKDFRNICTSFQTYKIPSLQAMLYRDIFLRKCAELKCDLIYTPYVGAASFSEGDYKDFILPVGSHYDNNGSDGILDNDDRHDITNSANIFLTNTIAVGARRETPDLYMKASSYGFGMEFFEDCSTEALDVYYPNKDIDKAFANIITTDGINITSTEHPNFANILSVNEEITIRHTYDPSTWQTVLVTEIVASNHIRVSSAINLIPNGGIYGWRKVTLGGFLWGQYQSHAVPLVAGKLKVIKMTTGKDWDTVRAAARATAKRKPLGIPELDNTNWDMYRGFGIIDVQAAINYINNNT